MSDANKIIKKVKEYQRKRPSLRLAQITSVNDASYGIKTNQAQEFTVAKSVSDLVLASSATVIFIEGNPDMGTILGAGGYDAHGDGVIYT